MGDVVQLFTKRSKLYLSIKDSIARSESDPARAEKLIKIVDEIELLFKKINAKPINIKIQTSADCAVEIESMATSLKKHYSGVIFDLMDIILAEKIKNIDK